MASPRYNSNDARRQVGSPRPKGGGGGGGGRADTKDTLCRNILIYGKCRYETLGCLYNHDQVRDQYQQSQLQLQAQQSDQTSKKLTVDSPAFTPSAPKRATFTPNNANAAPFTPLGPGLGLGMGMGMGMNMGVGVGMGIGMGMGTPGSNPNPNPSPNPNSTSTPSSIPPPHQASAMDANNPYSQAASAGGAASNHMADYSNFGAGPDAMGGTMGMAADHTAMHDAFPNMQSMTAHLSTMGGHYPSMQYDSSAATGMINPGAFDAFTSRAYNMPAPNDPPRYHLYAPIGPEPVLKGRGNVRTSEIFINNELREEMQKKQAASAQVLFGNSPLPPVVGDFYALVPLDTTNTRKSTVSFGFNSWIYKAFSSKNGRPYCLRRLEDFQLSNANAVRRVNEWRSIWCGSIVHVEDAFTTTEFGDNSLVFVQDYYPCARTLLEQHFTTPHTSHGTQYRRPQIPETTLWSYLTQMAHAMRMIHGAGAAARCIELSKIIVVEKNRIRLSGCAILDVVKFSEKTAISQLQLQDLEKAGKVMLALMTSNPIYATATLQSSQLPSVLSTLQRQYKQDLIDAVSWLLNPAPAPQQKTIHEFMVKIQPRIFDEFDTALSRGDRLKFELGREIEHGRIARLTMKMDVVVDRPDYHNDPTDQSKSQETESMYITRLFRDYAFHQVDSQGHPVVDLGHIMECLNKADVGTEDQICLTSPDNETVFVISFAEIKKHIQTAFQEVIRRGAANGSTY